jgi:hypothetical protein
MILGPHRNGRELVDAPRQYFGFGPGARIFWHKRSAAFSAVSKAAQRRDFACDQLLSSQLSNEQQTQRNQRSNRGRRNDFDTHVRSPRPSPHGTGCHVNVSRGRTVAIFASGMAKLRPNFWIAFSRPASGRPEPSPSGRGLPVCGRPGPHLSDGQRGRRGSLT